MKFTVLSLRKYIEELASDTPIPGGGGTSALVAALGAALASMVGSIVLRKKKKASERRALEKVLAELSAIRRFFEHAVDTDPKVYQKVMGTYRKARKLKDRVAAERIVDHALQSSFAFQQNLASKIAETQKLIGKLHVYSKGSIANDLLVASALLGGAWKGAYYTAKINADYVHDTRRKKSLLNDLHRTPRI